MEIQNTMKVSVLFFGILTIFLSMASLAADKKPTSMAKGPFEKPYADIHKAATSKSAAGVFIYSYDPQTGKPVVLLGKRIGMGGGEWGNPGGGSFNDYGQVEDKTLLETAARELQEESKGYIHVTPFELQNAMYVDSDAQDVTYRMYFLRQAYINNPSQMLHPPDNLKYHWINEYSEFRWFPLEYMLNSLHQAKSDQETAEVVPGEKLHSPLFHLLKSPEAEMLLIALSQSSIANPKDFYLKTIPSEKPDEEEIRKKAADVVLGHSSRSDDRQHIVNEMKKKSPYARATQEARKEAKTEVHRDIKKLIWELTQGETGSRIHMKEMLNLPENSTWTNRELVGKFLEKFKPDYLHDAHYVSMLVQALDAEGQHNNKIPFYHGADSMASFMYDVFTAVRAALNLLPPSHPIFRGRDSTFQSLQDVHKFIEAYTINGLVDNYATVKLQDEQVKYGMMGLSANLFLFGNVNYPTSATFMYFWDLKSEDRPNYEAIFNDFMRRLGIQAKFQDYLAIYQKFYFQNGKENGKLYQIFCDPTVVDKVAYLSATLGRVLHVKLGEGKPEEAYSILRFMAALKTSKKSLEEILKTNNTNLNDVQARLFLKPEIFHDSDYLTIKTYWRYKVTSEFEKTYQDRLNAQVRSDFQHWLSGHIPVGKGELHAGSPLRKLYAGVYEGTTAASQEPRKYKEQSSLNQLPAFVESGDVGAVRKILDENPDFQIDTPVQDTTIYGTYGTPPKVKLLELALRSKKPAMLELFKEKGANFSVALSRYWTPLTYAMGHENATPEFVSKLIELGANPNEKDENGKSIFDKAFDLYPDYVPMFLENGMNLEAKNDDGLTSLHQAAKNINADKMVSLLIAKGAKVNAQTKLGTTPVMLAAKNCKLRIVEFFTEAGADLTLKRSDGLGICDFIDGCQDQELKDKMLSLSKIKAVCPK